MSEASGPNPVGAEDFVENRTFEEIQIGDTASLMRTLGEDDIKLFALVSGDVNPAHVDQEYADREMFHRIIAHGMWGGALISAVLGTELPGPGAVYLGQSLRFLRPVGIGDAITARVTVSAKHADRGVVEFDCVCLNQLGEEVITGQAEILAPREKVRRRRIELPEVRFADHAFHDSIMARARGGERVVTGVVHPCSPSAIRAALEAAEAGLIEPVLIGPPGRIEAAAREAGVDIGAFRLEAQPHSHAAAARAVAMVHERAVAALMKGSLHTDELMAEVVKREGGLRTERRVSHAFVMSFPGRDTPLIITDAAINIEPGLAAKADIVRNAIDLAHVVGLECPKVAILAAVETVNPEMRSTLEAAALCKMADRGQITGGLLDGPLAYDNAVSEAAAREKGIVSKVAGKADILLVPDLEAGNMLAKQLTFTGGADAAGVVLGARVPIILTSRADNARTRLASCAVAAMLARADTKAAPGPIE